MIVFGMEGHHVSARNKFGTRVGQILMVSDYDNKYIPRLVLEPMDNNFTEIHAMKLVRQLVDAFNESKPLQTWEKEKDELMVYHAKYRGNGTYIFLSTTTTDFQIGYLPYMINKDNATLGNLICHILNGFNIDRFSITPSGDVIDKEDKGDV